MQSTNTTFKPVKLRINKLKDEWIEERNNQKKKRGKIRRGKIRNNKRSQWDIS